MTNPDPKVFAIAFPFGFVGLWLAVTIVLGFLSGWYALMAGYPDRDEAPLLATRWQSAMMGLGVSMRGILRLEACPSGLRLGIMRAFGPFSGDIFVPWNELEVTRGNLFLWPRAVLRFGGRAFPKLWISQELADRLARAAPGCWPEAELPPPKRAGRILLEVFGQWLAMTALAAGFFTLAPRFTGMAGAGPPLSVAVGFPAAVFGVYALFQAFRRLTD